MCSVSANQKYAMHACLYQCNYVLACKCCFELLENGEANRYKSRANNQDDWKPYELRYCWNNQEGKHVNGMTG